MFFCFSSVQFQGNLEVEILGNSTNLGCFWGAHSGQCLPILPIFLSLLWLPCPMLECFRGETCFMLPWMSCSKHGLDAWLVVGCFKSTRSVHCHFIISFVLFERIALLPACLILFEFRFLWWHPIEIFVHEVEANDVYMVKQFEKRRHQRCCRVVHCILTIFGMSTLPTVHHADSALHGPGKVSSDWKVGRESSAAGVD